MTFCSSGSSIDYPTLGCAGRLVPAGSQGASGLYHEEITSGTCDRGGTWSIKMNSADGVYAVWTHSTVGYSGSKRRHSQFLTECDPSAWKALEMQGHPPV